MTNGKEIFTNEIDFSDYDKQKDLTVMENRYDKYKDSGIAWIGEIPEHWNISLIGRYFKEINNPNSAQEETNTLQFKLGEIIPKSSGNSKYNPESIESYNIVGPGTIMINGLNLSFDFISQRVAQVKEKGAITSSYIAIYPTDKLFSNYATFLLKSYDNCKALHAMGKGLRAILSYNILRSESIIIPPLAEQQAIADYLDRRCSEIDDLIALQEEMITKLQSYKQSVITEAVTRGLDKNVPLKDSDIDWIGKIPEHWKVKRLKGIYSFGKGLNITKADLIDNGIPVISYGQLHSKLNTGTCIKDCLIRYVPEIFLENNSASLVKKGDVIFADTSEDLEGCGNCIYIDRDMLLYAGYHTIIAKNISSYHNKYFSYLFQTDCWRFQIRRMVNGVKLFSIPQRLLASTNIITPSIQEQQAIADYLDQRCSEIDELIALKQQKIEKLKEYKKSLIFECVTGKRKVS